MRDTHAFTATNKPWNDLKLNHCDRIGAVMALIKNSRATCFEEWEAYYLNTGKKRISKLPRITDEKALKNLNRYSGRTTEELMQLAEKLADRSNIPLEKAYNYVYIRVIDETWLGYEREFNVLKQTQSICSKYSNLTASGVDSITDTKYAVDFEIRKNNRIVLGIQLKSTKYRDSTLKAVDEVKAINKAKNDAYTERYGAPVLYLYIDENNIVVNINELIEFLDSLYI